MNTIANEIKVCPKCGESYKGRPALSREDNQTAICPLCVTKEAQAGLGLKPEEIAEIIQKIPQIEDK